LIIINDTLLTEWTADMIYFAFDMKYQNARESRC